MAVENLKSATITSLDTVPVVQVPGGRGKPGMLQSVGDYVTPSASASTTSTYKAVRVPTIAKVKHVFFESEAQAAGKFDVGVNYSDGTLDGTTVDNQGDVIDQDFFATAIDCASAVLNYDVVNESGTNGPALRNKPLWEALGLSTDPGGYFDIVLTVITTAVTTGTGKVGINVEFCV